MRTIVFLDQGLRCGGAEKILCTVMRSLDPLDYEVHLILTDRLYDLTYLVPKHVKIHELEIAKTRSALFSLIKVLWSVRPDFVFSSTVRTILIAILAKIVSPNFRLIGRYPTMPSKEIAEGYLSGWRLALSKIFLKRVDCLVSQTREMKEDIVSIFGINSANVVVIGNPIDVVYMEESVKTIDSPFETDTTNILGIGTLYPVKGFDVLVKAFALFCSSHPTSRLHLVGRDRDCEQEKLEELARALGVFENVTFHGFQSNPYPYLKYCDLFVLSSRREGLPNVLLEAQYFNRPVVATRCVPVIQDLVSDGSNGCLCEVDDAEGMKRAMLEALELRKIKNPSISNMEKFAALFRLDSRKWKV